MVERIDNGRNGGAFLKWWNKTSIALISGLLSLLLLLCFAIVGYNFAGDEKLHQQVEHLKTCKVEVSHYLQAHEKVNSDLRDMRIDQKENFRELQKNVSEIKDLIVKMHAPRAGGR